MVMVASAGNDASIRPTWPAAYPEVIGVAALGPAGPAAFSNAGHWVDCCAPGVDLVSTFHRAPRHDPPFHGWARWSGTSFAAPLVAAMIAREVQRTGDPVKAAAERVVRPAHRAAIPGYGTVVAPTP